MNNGHLFLIVVAPEKPRFKAPANQVSGIKARFLVHRCLLTVSSPGGMVEGTLWGLLYKSPLWCDLITSQRPHLQTLSHWALGFNMSIGGLTNIQSIARLHGCNGILDVLICSR